MSTTPAGEAKIEIGGLFFDDLSQEESVIRLLEAAIAGRGGYVATPNATIAHAAFADSAFASLINRALLVLPDGVGITAAARLLGTPFVHGRQAGVAFGEAVASAAAEAGLSLYLLGGREGVASRAADALRRRHPSLRIAGCRNGYFEDSDRAADAVASSGASLLFCCLGSPRQEYFAAAEAGRLSCPILCLGGSLDIYAGDKKRAPLLFQRAGCEWLWRTLAEPSRIRRLPALFAFLSDIRRLSEKNGPAAKQDPPLSY